MAPRPGQNATVPYIYNMRVAPALGLPLYTDAYRSTCYYCQYGPSFPEFSDTTYKNAQLRVGWSPASGLDLKSITGWQSTFTRRSFDQDSTPLPVAGGILQRDRTLAFSQELQLNGKILDGKLNFVSGLFYYNERQPGEAPERNNVVNGSAVPTTDLGSRGLKSYAAYIDGSIEIVEKLTLLGGFRYSEDHKSIEQTRLSTGSVIASARKTFDSSTFRAGLQYAWTKDIMTYVNVATGFRAGGFNIYSPANTPVFQPFDPETATNYELGVRMQFLDRRITINPTIFYTDWSKIQVQAIGVDQAGVIVRSLQNAGAARSYGLELEWAVAVTDALRLSGNFAYLDLKYTDIGTATGITINSDLQRAPPLTFSIAAAHTARLNSGARIVSSVNFSFNDDQRSTATDADTLILPAYGVLNARIEFTDPSGRYSLSPFVTNVLNQHYAVGGVNFYANVGAARFDLGRPREFGATARVKF